MLAIEEADVILFMVDAAAGIHDLDTGVADLLRKKAIKVILVVNKVDNNERLMEATEFYSLGLAITTLSAR
jgi:GTP-binding protein